MVMGNRVSAHRGENVMRQPIGSHFKRSNLAAPGRILVATDLNDMDYLVPHVVTQAKASCADVIVVHAVAPSGSLPIETAIVAYPDRVKIDGEVRLTLASMTRRIKAHGIACSVTVKHGYAANVIREEISRTGATRLIMGTHGRGKLGQLALGSIAHDLLTNVDIPIFAIGPHAHATVDHVTPRNILHPVSLMGDYQQTFHLALDIAQTYGAELTLLHVLDPDVKELVNPERTLDWARNALGALAREAGDLVRPIDISVTSGEVAEEVLKEAIRSRADWIVLGADGGFPSWSFRETVAYKVLAAANCPVVTLRRAPHLSDATNLEEVHFTLPL